MVDLKNILDIDKIRETKEQLQNQRMLNTRLSGWEEMAKHISSMEEGILETKTQIEQDNEYLLAQVETLQMLKSFIASRVELISPTHPLTEETERNIIATM